VNGVRRALISDIHGNFEALQTVLADIAAQEVSVIYCLGDIIGYGPNPRECLDHVMRKCRKVVLGNHDQAAMVDPEGFNPVALQAVYWTRDQLEKGPGGASKINGRWDFLGELPRSHSEGELLFVHGSPREPTNEYVFPEDIYNQHKLEALFAYVEKYCFQGHTHIPGVFTHDFNFITPEVCDYEYELTDDKAMINVGSVGQPRDGDSRACYVIFDDARRVVTFRRVEYPSSATRDKIYDISELDNMLGARLISGR